MKKQEKQENQDNQKKQKPKKQHKRYKIGKYPVKRTYKLTRLICDVLSLGIAYLIINATRNFFPIYEEVLRKISFENVNEIVQKYSYSLTYRHYFAWIFPALVLAVFAAYIVLTFFKSRKFEKYNITKQNAQSVYDWYAFAVSLCKLPVLLAIFDAMYIYHQRMMFNKVSIFSPLLVLGAMIVTIIVRLSVHRITSLTKTDKSDKAKQTKGSVRAKVVEPEESAEASDGEE